MAGAAILTQFERELANFSADPNFTKQLREASNSQGSTEQRLRAVFNLASDYAQKKNTHEAYMKLEHLLGSIAQADRNLAQQLENIRRCGDQAQRRKMLNDLMQDDALIKMCADRIDQDLRSSSQADVQNKSAMDLLKNFRSRAQLRASNAAYGDGETGVALYDLMMFMFESMINPYLAKMGKPPLQLVNAGEENGASPKSNDRWDPTLGRYFSNNM